MSTGVLDLLSLGAALAVAFPLAVFGASELAAGRTIGAVFLALAAGLVAVQHLLTTPTDVPARLLERAVGGAVEDPEEK
ncbi:MAG: hypothetical protein ABEJ42_08800 [Halobacteriaceae archaeon]